MLVLKALKFASENHDGQYRRASGEEYITHPIAVSYLLASYKQSKNIDHLLAAALLHDTVEDTPATIEDIFIVFGELVGNLVAELTSDDSEIKKLGKNEYLKTKLVNMSSYALTIKLVDRLSNIIDSPRDKYVTDTMDLLMHLENCRALNRTQKSIVSDIILECTKISQTGL